jgi:hypothetical protein
MLNMLILFLIILIACHITLAIYLIHAYASKPKKWPFHSKEKLKVVSNTGISTTVIQSTPSSTGNIIGTVLVLIFFIGIFSFFIVASYWSVKMSMKRYDIADSAIKKGNTGVAVAALSPEIGAGIGTAVSDLWGNNQ